MSDAIVRAVRPAEVERVHAAHRLAFAGSMGVGLGPAYTRRLVAWFAAEAEAIFLVAVVEGGPRGYVFGAPLGYGDRLGRVLMPFAARGLVRHPLLLLRPPFRAELRRRLASLTGLGAAGPGPGAPGALPAPAYSLVGIGVDPSWRGRGLGRLLMNGFEGAAVAYGARAVRLSVYKDNAVARGVYESCGWRVVPGPEEARTVFYAKLVEQPVRPPEEPSSRS